MAMKNLKSISIVISVFMLCNVVISCSKGNTEKSIEKEELSSNKDTVLEKVELHSYYIAENIILKSSILPNSFNPDSIEFYQFVEDNEGQIYQATLISVRKPPIFQEGIYPDIANGKRKFFIYANDKYDRNLIYIGTLLSSNQMIEAGFASTQTHSDTIIPTRRMTLGTPKRQETYLDKVNREFYEQINGNNDIEWYDETLP